MVSSVIPRSALNSKRGFLFPALVIPADDTGNDDSTENYILSLVRVLLNGYGFFDDFGRSRFVITAGKDWLRQKYQNR